MILAFSDGSYSEIKKRGACTGIILSDDQNYLGMTSKHFQNAISNSEVELQGVLMCLEYIKENISVTGQKIQIHCDCLAVIDVGNRLLDGIKLPDVAYRDLWDKFEELCVGYDIEMIHSPGHQGKLSPNSVCDSVSRRIVRRM